MHKAQPATLLIGQSGGATAVINASLVGILREALQQGSYDRILGLSHGIEGLFTHRYHDLTALSADQLTRLSRTPSAALGTGRYKLQDDDFARAVFTMQTLGVTAFIYIGGNDSADTAHRIGMFARNIGFDLQVMSVPKTIDNDLPDTDFCPGYPSIARYLGNALRDATYDTVASPQLYPVKFMEVMGRNAGWVTAATTSGFGPDEQDMLPILLLPERPPASPQAVLELIQRDIDRRGYSMVVLPETMRDAKGGHFGGETPEYVDAFGHPYHASTGAAMTRLVQQELGLRARYEKPGTAARMSISLASEVDLNLAERLGAAAVAAIANGETGKMTALQRVPGTPVTFKTLLVPQENVANRDRKLDDAFIGADDISVTPAFHAYLQPLLGSDPFPAYIRLAEPQTISGGAIPSAAPIPATDLSHHMPEVEPEVGLTVGDGSDGTAIDAHGDQFEIHIGQDVLGSCGNKIGEVVDVRDDYIVVEKGFFNPEDIYIPKDTIDSHNEHHLTLSISRDASNHAGWEEEPDTDDESASG